MAKKKVKKDLKQEKFEFDEESKKIEEESEELEEFLEEDIEEIEELEEESDDEDEDDEDESDDEDEDDEDESDDEDEDDEDESDDEDEDDEDESDDEDEDDEEESDDEDEDDEDESDDEDEDDEDDEDESDDEDEDDEEESDDEDEDDDINPNPVKNTMSDKTRYILITVACVLLVGLVICMAVFGTKEREKSNSNSNSPTKTERNTSTEFLKEFYKQMDSKERNVIFFASSTCGFCTLEKPIIENISKDYDMDYYAIDASTLTQEELNEVISALGIRGATPTTAIVQNGKVINYNEGYLDGKPYVEFFVENEILPSGSKYKQEDKIESINYSEFKDKAKKDKETLIFIDQSACQQCIEARSVLNELATKNDFKVYNLNAAYMTEEEINSFINDDLKDMKYDNEEYKSNKDVKIPLLLVVKKNKIKSYVVESSKEEDFTKVLKKYDFIK